MKLLKFIFLALVASFTFSCSSDDTDQIPQVTIKDFEGSWKASSAVYTNTSDASESVEFIGAGGEIRYTMLTGGQGRTRIWIEFQNNPIDEWDAIFSIGPDDTYKITPAEASRPVHTGTYSLGNNTITFTNNNDSFDFSNSGTLVPASSVTVFVPND